MTQSLDKDLLTVAETAIHLSCSTKTVLRLIHSGRLKAIQLGSGPNSRYRITSDSIEKMTTDNRKN